MSNDSISIVPEPRPPVALPQRVTTADGAVWVLRQIDADGTPRYAIDGAPADCPRWVMSSWAELVAHGVPASAGQAAELRHQYLDVDADSACVIPGCVSSSCVPMAADVEVTA